MSQLNVQIDLPGFQRFEVVAMVVHVLDAATAEKLKRAPGVGLQLQKVPEGFEEALGSYLERLGHRRDSLVLAEEGTCLARLGAAGYRTETADLARIVEQVSSSSDLLAVVVDKSAAPLFREALVGSPIPVIGCDCELDEDALLAELDRLLLAD